MADTTQIAVRMPNKLLAKVHAFAEANSEPGLELSVADAVRILVARAIDADSGGKVKKKR